MSVVFDSLARVIVLSFLAWMLIMLPVTVALAVRLDFRPALAVAFGLLPIPFLGWALVLWLGRHNLPSVNDGSSAASPDALSGSWRNES